MRIEENRTPPRARDFEHADPPEDLGPARQNDVSESVGGEAFLSTSKTAALAPEHDRGGGAGDACADDDRVESVRWSDIELRELAPIERLIS